MLLGKELLSKKESAVFIPCYNLKIMKVFLPQEKIILPWIKRQFQPSYNIP